MFCYMCGFLLQNEYMFCPKCGTPVEKKGAHKSLLELQKQFKDATNKVKGQKKLVMKKQKSDKKELHIQVLDTNGSLVRRAFRNEDGGMCGYITIWVSEHSTVRQWAGMMAEHFDDICVLETAFTTNGDKSKTLPPSFSYTDLKLENQKAKKTSSYWKLFVCLNKSKRQICAAYKSKQQSKADKNRKCSTVLLQERQMCKDHLKTKKKNEMKPIAVSSDSSNEDDQDIKNISILEELQKSDSESEYFGAKSCQIPSPKKRKCASPASNSPLTSPNKDRNLEEDNCSDTHGDDGSNAIQSSGNVENGDSSSEDFETFPVRCPVSTSHVSNMIVGIECNSGDTSTILRRKKERRQLVKSSMCDENQKIEKDKEMTIVLPELNSAFDQAFCSGQTIKDLYDFICAEIEEEFLPYKFSLQCYNKTVGIDCDMFGCEHVYSLMPEWKRSLSLLPNLLVIKDEDGNLDDTMTNHGEVFFT